MFFRLYLSCCFFKWSLGVKGEPHHWPRIVSCTQESKVQLLPFSQLSLKLVEYTVPVCFNWLDEFVLWKLTTFLDVQSMDNVPDLLCETAATMLAPISETTPWVLVVLSYSSVILFNLKISWFPLLSKYQQLFFFFTFERQIQSKCFFFS